VLYQSAPDGSGTRALTSHSDGVLRLDPAWSPDGRRIVYGAEGPAGTPFAGGGIAVMRSDGTGERLVTLDGAEPDWQPLAG
jgi:Tol biopolymer transport system component